MLRRVVRPTAAFLIIGASVCINCAEIDEHCREDSEIFRPASPLLEELRSESPFDNLSAANGLHLRPPSPVASIEGSGASKEASVNYEDEPVSEELINSNSPRSSSNEYDGDFEESPPSIHSSPNNQLFKVMSTMKNNISAIFSRESHEEPFSFDSFYHFQADDQGEELDYDNGIDIDSDNCADNSGEFTSSLDSLVQTRGGSDSSNRKALRQAAVAAEKTSESELETDIDIDPVASKLRSESPFTRPSRVSSIESETGCSAVAKVKMSNISPEQLAQFDKIAGLAGPVLKQFCKNAGVFILENLIEHSNQITFPAAHDFAAQDFMIFEQLSQIYFRIPEDDVYEYEDLIVKCLEVTLEQDSEYNKFRLLRDAFIVLMLNNPSIFDESFFDARVFRLLRKIVVKADRLGHLDTLDYIRQLLNFHSLLLLQEYFKLTLKLPERKLSDEFFLPLKADNLSKVPTGSKTIKSGVVKRSKKRLMSSSTSTSSLSPTRSLQKIILGLPQLAWENRRMLLMALLIAVMAQYFFVQK